MNTNIKKQIENLAKKFSNFPNETNYNNKRSNNYFGNKLQRKDSFKSKNSTIKDSLTETVKIFGQSQNTAGCSFPHHQKRSSSKIFYIINNNQLQSKFEICFDIMSTKKVLYKLPAKEINSEDSFEETDEVNVINLDDELATLNESYIVLNEEYDLFLKNLELHENFLKNFENFAIFLSKSKENLDIIEKWFDNKNFMNITDSEDFNTLFRELNKQEIILFGLVMSVYDLIKANQIIESKLYSNLYQNMKSCMQLIYKNLLIFISIITERKSQDTLGLRILYERKLLENKFIQGTENLKTIEKTNITINTNLLEMINELSEYYIERDTKHEEINYDLKNLEYMFYSLKNIKIANNDDIRVTIYNDVLLRNLLKTKVVDFIQEEDDSYLTENETEDSNNLPQVPYLPPINEKFTYTLVVDLDETLVHYMEEENEAFVQVRPFAEFFLNELSKYFEIVIFTAATEEVTLFLKCVVCRHCVE